jgi:hypothetical protein
MTFLPNRHPASTALQRVPLGLNHLSVVMAGLVPAIHVFLSMDARDKPAHDEVSDSNRAKTA